jgi:bacterioferritin-associated ferredoxin
MTMILRLSLTCTVRAGCAPLTIAIQSCLGLLIMATAEILSTDRIVCRCLGIAESEIRCALMEGTADGLSTLMSATGAGTGCTCCHRAIKDLIARQRLQAQSAAQCDGASSSPTCVMR